MDHAPASGPDPARDSYFLRHPLTAYSGLRGSQNHLVPSSAWWLLGFWTDSAFWDLSYIFISPLPDLFPILSSTKASAYYSVSFGQIGITLPTAEVGNPAQCYGDCAKLKPLLAPVSAQFRAHHQQGTKRNGCSQQLPLTTRRKAVRGNCTRDQL